MNVEIVFEFVTSLDSLVRSTATRALDQLKSVEPGDQRSLALVGEPWSVPEQAMVDGGVQLIQRALQSAQVDKLIARTPIKRLDSRFLDSSVIGVYRAESSDVLVSSRLIPTPAKFITVVHHEIGHGIDGVLGPGNYPADPIALMIVRAGEEISGHTYEANFDAGVIHHLRRGNRVVPGFIEDLEQCRVEATTQGRMFERIRAMLIRYQSARDFASRLQRIFDRIGPRASSVDDLVAASMLDRARVQSDGLVSVTTEAAKTNLVSEIRQLTSDLDQLSSTLKPLLERVSFARWSEIRM